MEYYSAIKKDEMMPFVVTWTDMEIIILSEVRKDNTMWYHLYVESIYYCIYKADKWQNPTV